MFWFIVLAFMAAGAFFFLQAQTEYKARQHRKFVDRQISKAEREESRFSRFDNPNFQAPLDDFAQDNSSVRESPFGYDPEADIWPFEKKPLLTPSERLFYERLKMAVPTDFIYVQVPLSQMMRVKRGHDFAKWNNRINRMSVDFVICDENTNIITAIELDGPSHDNPKRQADDAKKDKALKCAETRIIRWRVENMPSREAIYEQVYGEVLVRG